MIREYTFRTAAGAKPRIETLHGREYYVVPVVALKEGVIHAVNADRPEYVPYDRLARAAATWNGRPLVINHTVKNGEHVSANSPEFLEKQAFGIAMNSRMVGAKMALDAWVDPTRLEALGQRDLLERVKNGDPIEVSVGANVKTLEEFGEFGGQEYYERWDEILGDHIAFLPRGRGACSIEMGCGACRAAEARAARTISQKQRDKIPQEDFAGPHETYFIQKPEDVESAVHLVGKAKNPGAVKRKIISIAYRKGSSFVAKLPDSWKRKSASQGESMTEAQKVLDKMKVLLGIKAASPNTDAAEEAAELVGYKTMRSLLDQIGDGWDATSALVDELISDETDDPTENADEEAAEETVETARIDAINAQLMSMWSLISQMQSICYRLNAPDPVDESDARYAEARAAKGARNSKSDLKKIQAAHDATHEMHSNTVALGAQCNGMKLLSSKPSCGCGDPAAKGDDDMKMSTEQRAAAIKSLTENPKSGFTKDDAKWLGEVPCERLEALVAQAEAGVKAAANKSEVEEALKAQKDLEERAAAASKSKSKDGSDDGDDDNDEEDNSKSNGKGKDKKQKGAAAAESKPKTVDEFLKDAPAEVVEIVNGHRAAQAATKTELVTKLKSLESVKSQYTEDELKALSVKELKRIAAIAGVNAEPTSVDYSGRGLAYGGTNDTDFDEVPDPYAPGIKALQGQK